MSLIFSSLYRREKERIEHIESVALEFSDSLYFEKVKLKPIMKLLFFIVPFFPIFIILNKRGLGLVGVLYNAEYPWTDIKGISSVSPSRTLSGFPIKLNSSFSGLVEVTLKVRKAKIIISPEDREAFLEVAHGFLE